jgi:FHS family L-fucose permease-like MFS transporter
MVVITMKLGWVSVFAVFLSFFFMSIMFPTIFALGIHGLGAKAKLASSFIVMAIMGGAIMPKLMGWLGDTYNMSVSFAMPAGCFAVVAAYGFIWPRLSGSPGLVGVKTQGGH